jgi:hypothetical protein
MKHAYRELAGGTIRLASHLQVIIRQSGSNELFGFIYSSCFTQRAKSLINQNKNLKTKNLYL